MRPSRRGALLRLSLAPLLAALACGAPEPSPFATSEHDVHPALLAQTAEFEPRVHSVTDRVHVAVGYALGNSILVEGTQCDFVVDVTESIETAKEVRRAFENLSTRPIGALVYTHNHADHIFGARGFVPEGTVDVYANARTEALVHRVVSVLRPIISARSDRMFGTLLPTEGPDRIENAGIGPALAIGHGGGTISWLPPTHTFDDRLEATICGRRVVLVHAPGETDDQIFVWLPDERVLLPGDNVYKAFPNLYTIRGTPYRDVLRWVASLDAMRALEPDHLVMSHTRPLSGSAAIADVLTAYRDAVQYVHDQTVRGMNRGLTPDELVERVRLPEHLATHPYLQELYGTVEWSVRNIFQGYLGWFDGDAATLLPAAPAERAAGYVELAGGQEALLAVARERLDAGHPAFAAELAGHVLRLEPEDRAARSLQAEALRSLGRAQSSPNGRHFFLTQALELEGRVTAGGDLEITDAVAQVLEAIPIGRFIEAMPVNLDPEKSDDADLRVGFDFGEAGAYGIHVRRGVAEVRPGLPAETDLLVRTSPAVWKDLVTGRRNAALVMATLDLEGSRLDLVRFLSWFAPG